MADSAEPECPCGGDTFGGGGGCAYVSMGYPWCRPCEDHHRPPECAIDELGRALMGCGCPWDQCVCDFDLYDDNPSSC